MRGRAWEPLMLHLFDRDLVSLAPRHAYAGVHVVDLGRAERNLLVVVAIPDVDLDTAQHKTKR